MDDPWQPYVDGDPACQPRRLHLDATTPPRAPAVLISPLQRSLSSPFRLASSAAKQQPRPSIPHRLRPSQPAKCLTRASYTSVSPPWPLSSTGKAALPTSEPFFLAGVPPELTGDVARPLCSTISLHFYS